MGLEMKYFVLKPRGTGIYAAASRTAMFAYARTILGENEQFSNEIREWASKEMADALYPDIGKTETGER